MRIVGWRCAHILGTPRNKHYTNKLFPKFLLIPEATKIAHQYFCNFLNPTEES